MIEVDDALDESRREDPDAAEIQQVHRVIAGDRVIAEMRVAVDHAVVIERHIPDPEHAQRDPVAQCERSVFGEIEDRAAFEPGHRQQTTSR